jgi:hypothetical protein
MINLLSVKKFVSGAQEVSIGFNYLMNLWKGIGSNSHQGRNLFILPICMFVLNSFDISLVRMLVFFLNAQQMLHHQLSTMSKLKGNGKL